MNELLTGVPGPLGNAEFTYWQAYWKVKNEIQDTEAKKSSKNSAKGAPEGPRMKKTMGS